MKPEDKLKLEDINKAKFQLNFYKKKLSPLLCTLLPNLFTEQVRLIFKQYHLILIEQIKLLLRVLL